MPGRFNRQAMNYLWDWLRITSCPAFDTHARADPHRRGPSRRRVIDTWARVYGQLHPRSFTRSMAAIEEDGPLLVIGVNRPDAHNLWDLEVIQTV